MFFFSEVELVKTKKKMLEIYKQMLDKEMEKMHKTFKELKTYTMETRMKLGRIKDNL